MLETLAAAHKAGRLHFFGEHAYLAGADAFARFLAPLKKDGLVRLFQAPVRHVMSTIARIYAPVAARVRRRFRAGHGGTRPAESQRTRSGLLAACLRLQKPRSQAVTSVASHCCAAPDSSPVIQTPDRTSMDGSKSSQRCAVPEGAPLPARSFSGCQRIKRISSLRAPLITPEPTIRRQIASTSRPRPQALTKLQINLRRAAPVARREEDCQRGRRALYLEDDLPLLSK
jgi:hypothetical protein